MTEIKDADREDQKQVIKEAIKDWLNEKVMMFGWYSIKTIFFVFVAGLAYAWFVTHGWNIPK
jgi:hypothetical protein